MTRKHSKSKQLSAEIGRQKRNKFYKRNLFCLWIGLGALLAAFVGILLFSPKGTQSVEITPAQAFAKYQQGAFVLDVRSQDEWNQYHIHDSKLIPLDELSNRITELPKDKDIVVVCLSGHRSQSGSAVLQQAGITRVFCLRGGLKAWMDANYPIEKAMP